MRGLKELQDTLSKMNIYEYQILELSRSNVLTILGSMDFCYYHEIEIYIYNPSFISIPYRFSEAIFRAATDNEIDILKEKLTVTEVSAKVLCVELDKLLLGEKCEKHFIVAEEISFKEEIVYHYKRENLKDGESIADWVD